MPATYWIVALAVGLVLAGCDATQMSSGRTGAATSPTDLGGHEDDGRGGDRGY